MISYSKASNIRKKKYASEIYNNENKVDTNYPGTTIGMISYSKASNIRKKKYASEIYNNENKVDTNYPDTTIGMISYSKASNIRKKKYASEIYNNEKCISEVRRVSCNSYECCSELYSDIRISKLCEIYDIPSHFSLSCSSNDTYSNDKPIIDEFSKIGKLSKRIQETNDKACKEYVIINDVYNYHDKNGKKYNIFEIEINGKITPHNISDICKKPILIGGTYYLVRTSKLATDEIKYHNISIQCANDYQLPKGQQKSINEIKKYINARTKFHNECNEIAIRIINYLDDKYEHLIIGKCIIHFHNYLLTLPTFKLFIQLY
jgi:hypothetical protein